jgi:hypothetical protein
VFPLMAQELVKARVEELRREGGARTRRAGGTGMGRPSGLRTVLGVRLVSMGCRLLKEPVRIERAKAG